jgi:hypothetical protein
VRSVVRGAFRAGAAQAQQASEPRTPSDEPDATVDVVEVFGERLE